VAAELQVEKLPVAETLACLNDEAVWGKALTGGDDYELCFTLAKDDWPQVSKNNPEFTAIGRIVARQSDQNNLRLAYTTSKITNITTDTIAEHANVAINSSILNIDNKENTSVVQIQ